MDFARQWLCLVGLNVLVSIYLSECDVQPISGLVVFDLEGTLIEEELLVELAKIAGKEEKIRKIMDLGLNGTINWEVGLRKRIDLLKGLEYDDVLKISEKYTLKRGAKKACIPRNLKNSYLSFSKSSLDNPVCFIISLSSPMLKSSFP